MTALPLSSIRAFILDMDGVLWRSEQPIGDLPEVFRKFDRHDCRVVLATNNSTLSVDQYLKKLEGLGVHLDSWQIVTSSQAAALSLRARFPGGGPVFIIGEKGLVEALDEQGFAHDERRARVVVVGMDRQLSYDKLSLATHLIRGGAPFIATNSDRTFPTPQGLVPGAGAILAALETATDVKPLVVGKPSPEMYRVALDRLGTDPAETMVVGDRLETDIVGAQALGCRTALVLSGVTSEIEARAWYPPLDVIAPDLFSLLSGFIQLD